jgi:hypothetical protein
MGEKFRTGFLVRNPKGRRPVGKPKRGYKDNMDVKEVVWKVVDN